MMFMMGSDFLDKVREDASRNEIDLSTPPAECWMPIRDKLQDREYELAGRYFTMAMRNLHARDVKIARQCMDHDASGCAAWLLKVIDVEESLKFAAGAVLQQKILDAGIDESQRGSQGNPQIETWARAYTATVNTCIKGRLRFEEMTK